MVFWPFSLLGVNRSAPAYSTESSQGTRTESSQGTRTESSQATRTDSAQATRTDSAQATRTESSQGKKKTVCVSLSNPSQTYVPFSSPSGVNPCNAGYYSKQGFTGAIEGMASQWTNVVPNWVICDWFYVFFLINAIVVVLAILALASSLFSKGLSSKMSLVTGTPLALSLIVATTQTLFMYLLCDRSLKP